MTTTITEEKPMTEAAAKKKVVAAIKELEDRKNKAPICPIVNVTVYGDYVPDFMDKFEKYLFDLEKEQGIDKYFKGDYFQKNKLRKRVNFILPTFTPKISDKGIPTDSDIIVDHAGWWAAEYARFHSRNYEVEYKRVLSNMRADSKYAKQKVKEFLTYAT